MLVDFTGFLGTMAPDPRKHSAKKGKARMYLCSRCNIRHASPTGAKCQRQNDVADPDVSQMSSAPSTDAASPRETPNRRRRMASRGSPVPSGQDNSRLFSDDESLGVFLEHLDRRDANATLANGAIAQPEGAPPSTSSPSIAPTPGTSQREHVESNANAPVTNRMFNVLCEQMAIMAEAQSNERQRAERVSQASMEAIKDSLISLSGRLASCEDSCARARGGEAVRSSKSVEASDSGPNRSVPIESESSGVAGTSSQRIDPMSYITPATLAGSIDPVRTLRRNRTTATDATSILREIALMESGKKRKGGLNSNSKSNMSQVEADWPDLYVYRLGNPEPTYDSLSLAEFVAGYLSIMEEVTPLLPANTPMIRHLTYLRHLMEDCFLADWEVVKMAPKQVLCSIEHKRLTWENMPMVMDTKRTALTRIQHSSLTGRPAVSVQPEPPANTSVCQLYQNLTCPHLSDHVSNDVTSMHCCAFCMRMNGCKHTHPEINCRKAKEAAKQKQGRGQKRKNKE